LVSAASIRAPRRPVLPWAASLPCVFFAALAWRLLFLARLAKTPFWESFNADAAIYWEWSGAILRHGPVGPNPFFLGPLYPYFLAGLRLALGDSVPAILVSQAVLGAIAATLLSDAARRLTTPGIGLIIGLLLAGYEMAIFFDGLLLMESLLFVLESVLIWVVVCADWQSPRPARLVLIGLLIGALAQGRGTALLLLIPMALTLRSAFQSLSALCLRLALIVVASCLVVAPSALHNLDRRPGVDPSHLQHGLQPLRGQ